MRLPRLRRRTHSRELAEHGRAMSDLGAKDAEITQLLNTADDLVSELRGSLGEVTAMLRGAAGEGDNDSGREPASS